VATRALRGRALASIVRGMERPRSPWHRDGLPAWGWAGLILLRIVTLAWTLLPAALLAAGIWWWTHGGSREAPRLLRSAVQHVKAMADSAFGR
jgi:hypothetical protein